MAEDYITRNEHTQSTQRIHDRIDPINDSSIRMEESSKRMETMVKEMHNLLYGNGREGIITKISNLFIKVAVNRWITGVILVSILGTALFVIRSGLK